LCSAPRPRPGLTRRDYGLAAGAADYVMPDLERIGGVTGWQRAAALAEAFAIDSEQLPEGAREKAEILNEVHSNAAGIVRYLGRRATASRE